MLMELADEILCSIIGILCQQESMAINMMFIEKIE